jgi:hypothetical protein
MPEMIELFELQARHPEEDTVEIDVELLPAEIEMVLRSTARSSRVAGAQL